MGKSLIIKGADFSANAVKVLTWFIIENDTYGSGASTNVPASFAAYCPLSGTALQGKAINCIKLKAATAGTITLVKVSSNDASGVATPIATITIDADDIGNNVIKYFDDVQIGANDWFGIMATTDTGQFKYNPSGFDSNYGYYQKAGTASISQGTGSMALNVGYYG